MDRKAAILAVLDVVLNGGAGSMIGNTQVFLAVDLTGAQSGSFAIVPWA